LSAKFVTTFADTRNHVVNVTDPYGHILVSRPDSLISKGKKVKVVPVVNVGL
jgi:hypothetical protein